MKVIKVLGSGGPRCIETFKIAEAAINESGVEVILETVSNYTEILKFGFVTTPALVVEGTIKVMNRVPTKDEVIAWLKE
jgi:small redox-active disulfide protein 2